MLQSAPHPKNIRIDEYNYHLPEGRIAQFPLEQRDKSKLLIYRNGTIGQDIFSSLADYLPENSTVVFNETRVIHARMLFRKESGSEIEIFCLEPLSPYRDHQLALQQKEECEWLCLVGNSKRWKSGRISMQISAGDSSFVLFAERLEKMEAGTSRIKFSWSPGELTFGEVMELAGKIPLPPYIHRKPVGTDEQTYQTLYARQDGSVAAPTAGLHFSESVLESLRKNNIGLLKFILHVGAGTFKPVTSSALAGHEMHSEQVTCDLESLMKLRESLGKPLVAVGTTSVRLLESLYWHGVKVIHEHADPANLQVYQWDPYDDLSGLQISKEEALEAIISGLQEAGINRLGGYTSLLIAPGYHFRFPDILITNFHQPKSTLLLLISAFIGEKWREAYDFAMKNDFRFLSYGDSCLFFRDQEAKSLI